LFADNRPHWDTSEPWSLTVKQRRKFLDEKERKKEKRTLM
jgi:hypothetical protein